MFERFKSPALFVAKDSVLSAFACGKTTALVVDVGAEVTTVAPVQDGWLETKGKYVCVYVCMYVCMYVCTYV
jgi:hypothetical protein